MKQRHSASLGASRRSLKLLLVLQLLLGDLSSLQVVAFAPFQSFQRQQQTGTAVKQPSLQHTQSSSSSPLLQMVPEDVALIESLSSLGVMGVFANLAAASGLGFWASLLMKREGQLSQSDDTDMGIKNNAMTVNHETARTSQLFSSTTSSRDAAAAENVVSTNDSSDVEGSKEYPALSTSSSLNKHHHSLEQSLTESVKSLQQGKPPSSRHSKRATDTTAEPFQISSKKKNTPTSESLVDSLRQAHSPTSVQEHSFLQQYTSTDNNDSNYHTVKRSTHETPKVYVSPDALQSAKHYFSQVRQPKAGAMSTMTHPHTSLSPSSHKKETDGNHYIVSRPGSIHPLGDQDDSNLALATTSTGTTTLAAPASKTLNVLLTELQKQKEVHSSTITLLSKETKSKETLLTMYKGEPTEDVDLKQSIVSSKTSDTSANDSIEISSGGSSTGGGDSGGNNNNNKGASKSKLSNLQSSVDISDDSDGSDDKSTSASDDKLESKDEDTLEISNDTEEDSSESTDSDDLVELVTEDNDEEEQVDLEFDQDELTALLDESDEDSDKEFNVTDILDDLTLEDMDESIDLAADLDDVLSETLSEDDANETIMENDNETSYAMEDDNSVVEVSDEILADSIEKETLEIDNSSFAQDDQDVDVTLYDVEDEETADDEVIALEIPDEDELTEDDTAALEEEEITLEVDDDLISLGDNSEEFSLDDQDEMELLDSENLPSEEDDFLLEIEDSLVAKGEEENPPLTAHVSENEAADIQLEEWEEDTLGEPDSKLVSGTVAPGDVDIGKGNDISLETAGKGNSTDVTADALESENPLEVVDESDGSYWEEFIEPESINGDLSFMIDDDIDLQEEDGTDESLMDLPKDEIEYGNENETEEKEPTLDVVEMPVDALEEDVITKNDNTSAHLIDTQEQEQRKDDGIEQDTDVAFDTTGIDEELSEEESTETSSLEYARSPVIGNKSQLTGAYWQPSVRDSEDVDFAEIYSPPQPQIDTHLYDPSRDGPRTQDQTEPPLSAITGGGFITQPPVSARLYDPSVDSPRAHNRKKSQLSASGQLYDPSSDSSRAKNQNDLPLSAITGGVFTASQAATARLYDLSVDGSRTQDQKEPPLSALTGGEFKRSARLYDPKVDGPRTQGQTELPLSDTVGSSSAHPSPETHLYDPTVDGPRIKIQTEPSLADSIGEPKDQPPSDTRLFDPSVDSPRSRVQSDPLSSEPSGKSQRTDKESRQKKSRDRKQPDSSPPKKFQPSFTLTGEEGSPSHFPLQDFVEDSGNSSTDDDLSMDTSSAPEEAESPRDERRAESPDKPSPVLPKEPRKRSPSAFQKPAFKPAYSIEAKQAAGLDIAPMGGNSGDPGLDEYKRTNKMEGIDEVFTRYLEKEKASTGSTSPVRRKKRRRRKRKAKISVQTNENAEEQLIPWPPTLDGGETERKAIKSSNASPKNKSPSSDSSTPWPPKKFEPSFSLTGEEGSPSHLPLQGFTDSGAETVNGEAVDDFVNEATSKSETTEPAFQVDFEGSYKISNEGSETTSSPTAIQSGTESAAWPPKKFEPSFSLTGEEGSPSHLPLHGLIEQEDMQDYPVTEDDAYFDGDDSSSYEVGADENVHEHADEDESIPWPPAGIDAEGAEESILWPPPKFEPSFSLSGEEGSLSHFPAQGFDEQENPQGSYAQDADGIIFAPDQPLDYGLGRSEYLDSSPDDLYNGVDPNVPVVGSIENPELDDYPRGSIVEGIGEAFTSFIRQQVDSLRPNENTDPWIVENDGYLAPTECNQAATEEEQLMRWPPTSSASNSGTTAGGQELYPNKKFEPSFSLTGEEGSPSHFPLEGFTELATDEDELGVGSPETSDYSSSDNFRVDFEESYEISTEDGEEDCIFGLDDFEQTNEAPLSWPPENDSQSSSGASFGLQDKFEPSFSLSGEEGSPSHLPLAGFEDQGEVKVDSRKQHVDVSPTSDLVEKMTARQNQWPPQKFEPSFSLSGEEGSPSHLPLQMGKPRSAASVPSPAVLDTTATDPRSQASAKSQPSLGETTAESQNQLPIAGETYSPKFTLEGDASIGGPVKPAHVHFVEETQPWFSEPSPTYFLTGELGISSTLPVLAGILFNGVGETDSKGSSTSVLVSRPGESHDNGNSPTEGKERNQEKPSSYQDEISEGKTGIAPPGVQSNQPAKTEIAEADATMQSYLNALAAGRDNSLGSDNPSAEKFFSSSYLGAIGGTGSPNLTGSPSVSSAVTGSSEQYSTAGSLPANPVPAWPSQNGLPQQGSENIGSIPQREAKSDKGTSPWGTSGVSHSGWIQASSAVPSGGLGVTNGVGDSYDPMKDWAERNAPVEPKPSVDDLANAWKARNSPTYQANNVEENSPRYDPMKEWTERSQGRTNYNPTARFDPADGKNDETQPPNDPTKSFLDWIAGGNSKKST